jgi:hypothetical protein
MQPNNPIQSNTITIISDYLSSEEIHASLEGIDITLEPLISAEKTRGIDPTVLVAAIGAAATIVSPLITLIVTSIIEKNKVAKPHGLLILKSRDTELHIPFDLTGDELVKHLETIKNINGVEQVFIAEKKDGK